MSGERATHDRVEPDEQTDPWLEMGIVVAMLGGGPAPEPSHTDVAAPAGEESSVDVLDRP